jgi:hypothetical protein
MLPLLKRKSEKSAGPLVPAWHPNFRNFERLPDTKVVRTKFFVNGIAVVVALALLLVFAYQEFTLREVNRQIAVWQAAIARDERPSRDAVALFKRFQDEERKVLELEGFVQRRVALSDLLLELGRTLPDRIAINSVNYRDSGVVVRGVVRGSGTRASGEVSGYVERLRKHVPFTALFESIAQSSIARESQTDRMTFELFLKFKPAPAPARK